MVKNKVAQHWTMKEIEHLYINENYSMNLVARITKIPIADISRLLWKYNLPEKKRSIYGPNFAGEINKLPEHNSCFQPKFSNSEQKLADEFFGGL